MSKDSFQINNSLRLTPNAEPADPQNGDMYYDSTQNKFKKYENGAWTDLGSGGGVSSYITEGATGWTGYNDDPPATTRPVDGTGGSTLITLTDKTSTPISGTSSLLFTKPASNVRGQGVSKDFTIDIADKANRLTIEFPYLVNSGTFAAGSNTTDGDLIVYIYDVTNNRLIEPANFKFFSNSSTVPDKFIGTFQTSADSVSYRLILHVASTSASAFSLEMGQVEVKAESVAYGVPVTDWVSYTPTITHSSGGATNYTVVGKWRQVGDTMEVTGTAIFNNTSAAFAEWYFNIPSGYSIDSSKLNNSGLTQHVGTGNVYDNGLQLFAPGNVLLRSSTVLELRSPGTINGTNPVDVTTEIITNTNPITFSTGDTISWKFAVPIQGWSSNTRISDGYEGREVAARFNTTTARTINNTTPTIIYENEELDTTGSYNPATGEYTVPSSGNYVVAGSFRTVNTAATVSNSTIQYVYKNGSIESVISSQVISTTTAVRQYGNGSALIENLKAGDILTFRIYADTSTTLEASQGAQNYITIYKLDSGQTIAGSPIVALEASATNGTDAITSSLSVVKFTVKDTDTHNAYSTSTGLWTAPEAGYYNVAWRVETAAVNLSTSQRFTSALYKNGTAYRGGLRSLGVGTSTIHTSGLAVMGVRLNAGDTLAIYAASDVSTTVSAGASSCYFTIAKVG